jgi:hypothetical protein
MFFVSVLAHGRHVVSTKVMVAISTHAFRVMLCLLMQAVCDQNFVLSLHHLSFLITQDSSRRLVLRLVYMLLNWFKFGVYSILLGSKLSFLAGHKRKVNMLTLAMTKGF